MKIKKLHPNAIIPTYGSEYAAGADLYACFDADFKVIPPHETVKIGTGLAMEIDCGWWGGIYARSGLATKQGLAPANMVGVIDSDYRGEIIIAIHNYSNEERVIHNGDRIAQFIIHPAYRSLEGFVVVDELSDTTRGDGGFGSTGTN